MPSNPQEPGGLRRTNAFRENFSRPRLTPRLSFERGPEVLHVRPVAARPEDRERQYPGYAPDVAPRAKTPQHDYTPASRDSLDLSPRYNGPAGPRAIKHSQYTDRRQPVMPPRPLQPPPQPQPSPREAPQPQQQPQPQPAPPRAPQPPKLGQPRPPPPRQRQLVYKEGITQKIRRLKMEELEREWTRHALGPMPRTAPPARPHRVGYEVRQILYHPPPRNVSLSRPVEKQEQPWYKRIFRKS